MASETSADDAAQTSATGSVDSDDDIEGDDEGKFLLDSAVELEEYRVHTNPAYSRYDYGRPPLSPMGWFMPLLAIGAGFML
jgi:hypothetical protein